MSNERFQRSVRPSMDAFLDFNSVHDRLFFSLVNAGNNRKLLADVPHILMNDMAIVFYLVIHEETQMGLYYVRNDLWKHWQVSEEVLFNHAQYNAPRIFGARISGTLETAKEILVGRMDAPGSDTLIKLIADGEKVLPMYVATNCIKYCGSGVVLYRGLLQQFAEQIKSDLVIVPGSVHNVMLIPADYCRDIAGLRILKLLLNEVNADAVAPEDVLSGDLYYYQRGVDGISKLEL